MKLFNKWKKKPVLSRTQALDCVVIKNKRIEETRLESGEVQLAYQLEIKPWAARLGRKIYGSEERFRLRKLQLDVLGTQVWDLMDDQRSVRQIIEEFAARRKLHPKEAEVAVTAFLRLLGRRGLVGLK